MLCPKCRNEMEEVSVCEVVIDRCKSCHGLWFDHGEPEALNESWVSEFLYVGDPTIGQRHDENDTIGCPRCGVIMRHHYSVDARLHFECCDEHGRHLRCGRVYPLGRSDLPRRRLRTARL